ncbi:MAG: NAD(P)/FAD-dependent oxidoreductase [Deltaproteobacteria bacterium]|nr:NAD(P)/FAD-dependent oxidoreductase [Deltaproteobacteria bacterium]
MGGRQNRLLRTHVLIVGAGPAGLGAALALLEKRVRVVVVDARKVIGSPVRCGEATRKDFFDVLGVEERPEWIRQRLGGGGSLIVLDRERYEFDVAQIAARRGAVVWPAASVVGVGPFDGTRRRVTIERDGERHELEAMCVIAADGVSSTVARLAGMDTFLGLDRIASGLVYQVRGATLARPDAVHVEPLPKPFPAYPYYFWVIPNGPGAANVGLYVPGRVGFRARELLDRMLAQTAAIKGGRVVRTVVGLIPDARPLQTPYADGLLVTGGAARLIHPLSGGGIGPAVLSGKAAARTILALGGKPAVKDALAEYRKRIEPIYSSLDELWRSRGETEEQLRRNQPLRVIYDKDWTKI